MGNTSWVSFSAAITCDFNYMLDVDIGMFYYFLGNIRPKLRSALRCTQLIACVTTPILNKYGFEMVLKPFIDEVNKLTEVSWHS